MKKFIFSTFVLLAGCLPKQGLNSQGGSTGSPCVDGIDFNIMISSCESVFYGHTPENGILKMRCAYSQEDSFYTTAAFYVLPAGMQPFRDEWEPFCFDRTFNVYVSPPSAGTMQQPTQ